jgi:hypothetical protein
MNKSIHVFAAGPLAPFALDAKEPKALSAAPSPPVGCNGFAINGVSECGFAAQLDARGAGLYRLSAQQWTLSAQVIK